MALTLQAYIENPLGKKNAVFSNRDMYRKLYTEKFDKLLLRENGNISYKLYTKDDKYYIFLRIPSEIITKGFYYDVVIEFYTDNQLFASSRSLSNYFFRVYSNSPSFVFTFCKAFLENDLFIKELSPKMSKEALKTDPVEKNPQKIIGYEKSLYFAYLWIKNKSLFNKSLFETYGEELVWKDLVQKIEHADSKIADRQKKGEELEKRKRRQKEEAKRELERQRKKDLSHISKNVATTKQVKRTSTIKSVKSSKTIKRTRKT